MPKTVIIMRHAQAESFAASDKARALTQKGQLDAQNAVLTWHDQYIHPQHLLYSTAKRTTQTAVHVIKKFQLWDINVESLDNLYTATPADIDTIISTLDDKVDVIAIIGHNNTLTDYLQSKISHFNIDDLPTAGIVGFNINIASWKENNSTTKGIYNFHIIRS